MTTPTDWQEIDPTNPDTLPIVNCPVLVRLPDGACTIAYRSAADGSWREGRPISGRAEPQLTAEETPELWRRLPERPVKRRWQPAWSATRWTAQGEARGRRLFWVAVTIVALAELAVTLWERGAP